MPRQQEIDVPEWGGSVVIQELTLTQQQAIASSVAPNGRGNADTAVKTFIEGVIDPQFDAADAEALAKTGVAAFQRVVNAIVELSGMGPNADKQIQGK